MKKILVSVSILLLSACGSVTNDRSTVPIEPKVLPPPPQKVTHQTLPDIVGKKPETKKNERISEPFSLQRPGPTKLDVLFVIDTSDSMCSDQARLSANINRFVDVFTANKNIDFHIGATVSWDSKLYGNADRCFKNGELRPLYANTKARGAQCADYDGTELRFATNKTPIADIKRLLKVGTESLNKKNPAISGPENEELFSPALEALSPELLNSTNKGFRRDDAHLAVIIITDTEDQTPDPEHPEIGMSAAVMKQYLERSAPGAPSITVLAALARYDEMIQYHSDKEPGKTSFQAKYHNPHLSNCNGYSIDPYLWDPLRGPSEISELVKATRGEAFDLDPKDDPEATIFGGRLAKMANNIVRHTLLSRIFTNKAIDTSEPIYVRIGGKKVEQDADDGFQYNPDPSSIEFGKFFDPSKYPGFNGEISYVYLH